MAQAAASAKSVLGLPRNVIHETAGARSESRREQPRLPHFWIYLDDRQRSLFLEDAWERRFSRLQDPPTRREARFALDSLSEGVYPRGIPPSHIDAVVRVADEYGLVIDAGAFARTGLRGTPSLSAMRRRASGVRLLMAVTYAAFVAAFAEWVAGAVGFLSSPVLPVTSIDLVVLVLLVIGVELASLTFVERNR